MVLTSFIRSGASVLPLPPENVFNGDDTTSISEDPSADWLSISIDADDAVTSIDADVAVTSIDAADVEVQSSDADMEADRLRPSSFLAATELLCLV
jgi:hypothetical protein